MTAANVTEAGVPTKTIVRVLPLPSEEAAFYVNEWKQNGDRAYFTVSINHPLSKHLMPHREQTFLAITSTEEVEWFVRSTTWSDITGKFGVALQSRASWARERLIADEYLEFLGMVS